MHVKGQLERAQAENVAADPSDAADKPSGRLWINTDTNLVKYADDDGTVRTVVNTDQAQTLTNKTIDADSNTISNIENADIKAAAAIAVNKLAAVTASRALASDASGFITPSAVTATELGYVAGVTSAIQDQIDNHLADTTTHGTTGNIVGTSDTQTLTNKTLGFLKQSTANSAITGSDEIADVSAGVIRLTDSGLTTLAGIAVGADGQSIIVKNKTGNTIVVSNESLDASADETKILTGSGDVSMPDDAAFIFTYNTTDDRWHLTGGSGSGSGSGGINYIDNPDAEAGTTGWATYADAAGTSPVDGTGGTPSNNISASVLSPGPLRGTYSFILRKDTGSDTQGEGWSYDFSIDNADKAKILQVSFDYIVQSGTFTAGSSSADSDVTVWVYDVTNSRVIQPSTYKLFSSSTTIADRFIANFQTSADSDSYRLIFHIGSTTANTFDLLVDNISVSPTTIAYGTPIRDGTAYTPTWTGFGTVSNSSGMWWQQGDRLKAIASCTVGTRTADLASVSLPTGLSIDADKLTITANTTANPGSMVGKYENSEAVANTAGVMVTAPGTSTTVVYCGSSEVNAASALTPGLGTTVTASSVVFTVEFEVPISGWSSQVQMSDVNDQRIVAARYTSTAAQTVTTGNTTIIDFATKVTDSHAAVTTGASFKFTAPTHGQYRVNSRITAGGTGTSGYLTLQIFKNGSLYSKGKAEVPLNAGSQAVAVDDVVELNAGDYVDVRLDNPTGANRATSTVAGEQFFSVIKLANPSLISATETIAASYWLSADFTSDTSTPINFDSKDFDTHNSVTTSATAWKFTAQSAGIYNVSIFGTAIANSAALYKNGVAYIGLQYNSGSYVMVAPAIIRLNAGDYIDVRMSASTSVQGNASLATANTARIHIHRIGL
jgi:hypothetical protein